VGWGAHRSALDGTLGEACDDLTLEEQDEDDHGDGDDPVGSSNWEAPVKKASAAGTGRAALVDVSEMPYTKSFQAMKNAMSAVVKTPGAARGTMALRNACQLVAPSTCAACSSSHGICRKNAARVQMEMGSVSDR
jgi:hypothetical protein